MFPSKSAQKMHILYTDSVWGLGMTYDSTYQMYTSIPHSLVLIHIKLSLISQTPQLVRDQEHFKLVLAGLCMWTAVQQPHSKWTLKPVHPFWSYTHHISPLLSPLHQGRVHIVLLSSKHCVPSHTTRREPWAHAHANRHSVCMMVIPTYAVI